VKKLLMVLLSAFFVLSVVACDSGKKPTDTEVKVGFIYIGDPADGGFTMMHDEGRKYMVEKLGVKTAEVYNVNDTDAQTFNTKVRELIDQGFNVIVACSYGFGQPQYELAKEFPDVKFLHFSGDFLNDNMGNFFGKMVEARYVCGAVAGMNIPEGGTIGYVAAFDIPEVIRAINAFTLGVQSTNPTATVKVYWTKTWFDPAIEKAAGEALVKQGVDAIAIHQDTPLAPQAATEVGKWGIGYHSDMSEFLGDDCLISAVWNFGPYYVDQVKAIQNGTWKPEAVWGGYADGEKNMVLVSKVSPKAKAGSQELADDLVAQLIKGELKIFAGPLYDNQGNLKIADGSAMSDADVWIMSWFVKGVTVAN